MGLGYPRIPSTMPAIDASVHSSYACLLHVLVGDSDRGLLTSDVACEAENLQWLVDILIKRKMGDEFVKLWVDQKVLHSKIPITYRHEISKRSQHQLCIIGFGRGQILVPGETHGFRCSQRAWLSALYEEFGWMQRACRTVDKKLIEDGLCQTIIALPLQQQQVILLKWFDQFLNNGDNIPRYTESIRGSVEKGLHQTICSSAG